MSDSLNTILAGAGLAGATGHRAFLPAFILGLMHRVAADPAGGKPFFALSEQFQWLSEPSVLAILGVLAVLEYVAEKNPDAPEAVNLALKAPKAVMGFIVAAGTVGTVDDSIVSLGASGLLGSATSLGVDTMRATVKHAVQEPLSDATAGASDKAMGAAETAWSGFLAVMAWVVPILALLGVGVLVGMWFGRRRLEKMGRIPCTACGFAHHPKAKVCPGCRREIAAAETGRELPHGTPAGSAAVQAVSSGQSGQGSAAPRRDAGGTSAAAASVGGD